MTTLRLARIAAQAEGLRIKAQLSRIATRIAMAAVAFVFLIAALLFAHIGVWFCLRLYLQWGQPSAGFAVAGGDLVLTMFFLFLASRSSPSRQEMDALQVRQRALQQAQRTLTLSAMLMPALRLATQLARRARK